jgi:hypothetical protein
VPNKFKLNHKKIKRFLFSFKPETSFLLSFACNVFVFHEMFRLEMSRCQPAIIDAFLIGHNKSTESLFTTLFFLNFHFCFFTLGRVEELSARDNNNIITPRGTRLKY